MIRPKTTRKKSLLLPAPLFLALAAGFCLPEGSVVAQTAWGYRPPGPSISLRTTGFEALLREGSLVLGKIAKIEQIGEEKANGWNRPDRVEYKVTIKIDRVILGKPVAGESLTDESLWLTLYPWLNEDGEPTGLSVGAPVFYEHYVPKRRDAFRNFMSPASATDIKRLDRVADILATADAATGAKRLLAGCLDRDPYFSDWCLLVVNQRRNSSFRDLPHDYRRLRDHITPQQEIDICWKLLNDPNSPSVTYESADRRLARESLSAEEQLARAAAHVGRLNAWCAMTEASRGERYYAEQELRYLLETGYAAAPVESRLEAITCVANFARSEDSLFRGAAIMNAAFLHQPGQKRLSEALFQLYRDCLPGADAPDTYRYRRGLQVLMRKESKATQSVNYNGLQLLETIITQREPRVANPAVSSLSEYARFCEKEKIPWPDLPQYFESLIAITPSEVVQNSLRSAAKELSAEPKPKPPAF